MDVRTALKIVLAACAFLGGCTSAGQRLDERAKAAGVDIVRVEVGSFPSLIYMKSASDRPGALTDALGEPLLVFLESDGIPWRNGREPSVDPTTERPVAFEMLLRSSTPAAYITRPCYHRVRSDKCNFEYWTGARYSAEVVESMAATVREAQRRSGATEVTLIGYSGGGVLAVLIAERLEHVASVVTIAANLDTDAWAEHHKYLPLSQSMNPALSDRPHPWPELHLRGAKDVVVPAATTDKYFVHYPQAQQRIIEGYDHVCCWVKDWQSLNVVPTLRAP